MCPFFTDKMMAMPSVTNLMKETYCHGDKMQCARYQVSTAGIAPPLDLFPNDHDRAKEILGKPH
ncbi:MAG: hypothetical protein WBL63_24330 [Candidatus Acidiferrum sp.]